MAARLLTASLSVGNPAEYVCHHVHCSRKVLYLVIVLLEPVMVTPLTACQLILRQNMWQRRVIRINGGAFSTVDLAGPIFQVCADRKKFTVICRISRLNCVKLRGEISQWPLFQSSFKQLFLSQNTSNSRVQGIGS